VGERDGTDFKRTHYQKTFALLALSIGCISKMQHFAWDVLPTMGASQFLIDKVFLLLFVHKKKILPTYNSRGDAIAPSPIRFQ